MTRTQNTPKIPDLYISEAPQDTVRHGVILHTMHFSPIYQGLPLGAADTDRSRAEKVAYAAADKLNKSVWTWYGQAGSFSSRPEYVPASLLSDNSQEVN